MKIYTKCTFFFRGINVLIQTPVAYWPDNWGRCEGSVVFVHRVARRRMMMWDTAAASVRDHCGWFQKGRHHCLAWSQLCFLILLNHCHTVKNKHTCCWYLHYVYWLQKNKDGVCCWYLPATHNGYLKWFKSFEKTIKFPHILFTLWFKLIPYNWFFLRVHFFAICLHNRYM